MAALTARVVSLHGGAACSAGLRPGQPATPGSAARPLARAAPARPGRQAGRLARTPCRAQQKGEGDFESEVLGSQGFPSLAKSVASRLASELAGQEGGFNRLKFWFDQASKATKRAEEAVQPEQGEQAEKGGGGGGVLHKAASIAANVLGVSGASKHGGAKEENPAAKAAAYLGADTIDLTVDSVKSWLTSPQRRDDVKMVAALVYKMLQFMEKETGESFQGGEHQYKWLTRLAQEVFGGSMTKSVVRALIDAYMRVPGR